MFAVDRSVFCPLLVGFLATATAFAARKVEEYPVHPASEYSVHTEKSGLTIGVEAVEDAKEQKVYFGAETTSKGFIPVFIVLQNDAVNSFLFEKGNVGYGGVSSGTTPKIKSKVGEGLAFLGPGLISMKLMSNATEVQQILLRKEVQSKTLSPGTSLHGFLYIPVPKNGPREKIHLQVPVTKSGTGETSVLNVIF